jgi:hypothetical protein
MNTFGQRKDWDYSWGLPHDEVEAFINYVNTATAIIMDETGKTRKQAHAALARKKPSYAVQSVLEYLHDNPHCWFPKNWLPKK